MNHLHAEFAQLQGVLVLDGDVFLAWRFGVRNYLSVCLLLETSISACMVSVRVRVDDVFHVDVELLDLLQDLLHVVSWVDYGCVSRCFVSDDVGEVSSDITERNLLEDQVLHLLL